MNSVIGFSLFYQLPSQRSERALAAQHTALGYFKHLHRRSLSIGDSRLELWGHNDLNERVHYLPDGTLLVLIGSPLGKASLSDVGELILNAKTITDLELPWDGRTILLRISADGKRWMMWNDWLGSIPVFHTKIGDGRIASTLEPVTVAAAGYTPDDFFLPGLVSLLINGHYLSDWTLYKDMKVIPPDSASVWDEKGFSVKQLWSVQPTQSRWETGWDELVDEMYELSREAVMQALQGHSKWTLPLSSGLDSRLIAAIAAQADVDVQAYAWGASNTTDAVYSAQIARALGIAWKRIDLPKDFLAKYTQQWAHWFGSSMHFHGMYQSAFYDQLKPEPESPVLSGFLGDILAGDDVGASVKLHAKPDTCQILDDWYIHWSAQEVSTLLKISTKDALAQIRDTIKSHIARLPGSLHQKMQLLEIQTRQRLFTNFQATVSDYWRGVATPFLNRKYARFCLSLPRTALDDRRLLGDVFRRYYGSLAVIPGTFASDPLILTGKYLLMRRVAKRLPPYLRYGSWRGVGNIQLRMDIDSVQAIGKTALWPLFENQDQLARWIDVTALEKEFQTLLKSRDDIRPLRKLQSIQTLAYRLMQTTGAN